MVELSRYKAFIIGIIIIIAASFLLAEAHSKKLECESVTGKIVQLLDLEKQQGCARLSTLFFIAYGGIAIGIALLIVQFVRND
jgi:hypothetical protein